jgi:hypothetical protein
MVKMGAIYRGKCLMKDMRAKNMNTRQLSWLGLFALGIFFVGGRSGLGATTNLLLPAGSFWRYLDDGSDQGIAWQGPMFDDSSWPLGQAQFGYGDADERTVLGFGTNARNKHLTCYFRTTVDVPDPTAFTGVTLSVLRDDGAVVYLNGTEVFRSNMPTGSIDYLTRASRGVSGKAERTYYSTNLSASVFSAGTNLLAVEIHQNSPASGDLSFDLQLAGVVNIPVITRGPYLQQGGTTNITVRWRTGLPTDSGVRYGTNPAALTFSASDTSITTEHEVRLTGLEPDTKYFYSIGTWGVPVAGDDSYFFVTAPIGPKPTRIWVIGDSGVQDQRPRILYSAYTNFTGTRHTDVWLMLGDNAYDRGTDKQYQSAVFNKFPELLRKTVAWSTIGNHETYSGSSADFPFLRIFSQPREGEAGGVPSGTERYFSFDHGSIHFVCLDAMTSDRSSNGPMCTWLRQDLAANDKEWLIAFWHHPPYSKGSHNSDTERELIQMRQNAVPILESYGVDLVLCGHSHSYERSFYVQGHYGSSKTFTNSMKVQPGSGREDDTGPYFKPDTGPQANQGTVYVVAGSSGHVSSGKLNHPVMYFGELELGTFVIDIDGSVLQARFLRETGAIDDYFTLIKGAATGPLWIVSYQQADGQLTLAWNTTPGERYRVEGSTRLSPANWTTVSEVFQAAGSTMNWSAPLATHAAHSFYRVCHLAD